MGLNLVIEVAVVGLVPAVGGLLILLMRLGREVARLKAQSEVMPRIEMDLRELDRGQRGVAIGVESVLGEIKAIRERTDMLLRQVDRHETFLYRTDSDARAT